MKTGTRIRNIAFCLVCIVVFCAAVLYKAADLTGTLPEQLDNGRQSYLEGAALQPLPEASLAAFASGDLQDEIEDYLSGCWPARDEALLANAAWQRAVIRAANIPWNYDVYPSYYGATRYYIRSYDAVASSMYKATEDLTSSLSSAADQYNEFASNHPQYHFFFYLPDTIRISPTSPVASLQTNTATWNTYSDYFLSNLSEAFTTISVPEESISDFYETHFRTDHHWNMVGAYEAYRLIAKELGVDEPLQASNPQQSSIPMYGSLSREAMLLTNEPDHIMDYQYNFDFSNYSVIARSMKGDSQALARSELLADPSEWENEQLSDRYAEYYPYRGYLTQIENQAQDNDRGLLIMGDSYARPIDRLFAAHYSRVYLFDPRYSENATLSDVLNTYEIDDILFIETPEAVVLADFLNALQ